MNKYIKFFGITIAAIAALVFLVLTMGNKLEKEAPATTVGVNLEYGKFMADSCIRCHGEDFSGGKINITESRLAAQNLTPDKETGLGNWSETDFIKSIRTGKRPDGSTISSQMGWARISNAMTDIDLKALWLYLNSLPAKKFNPE